MASHGRRARTERQFVLFRPDAVSPGFAHEEIRGLDVDEHGMEAYPNFQLLKH